MSARNRPENKEARRLAKAARKVANDQKYWGPKMYLTKDLEGNAVTKQYPNRADLRAYNKQERRTQAKEHKAHFLTVHMGRITTNIDLRTVNAEVEA